MKRFKLTVEYKGTRYNGWQSQRNGVGVQDVLEGALAYVLNERVRLVASGRTDTGVHAMGQVAHFDTETRIVPDKIPAAANSQLPDDVSVLSCEEVSSDFSARHTKRVKTYLYKIYVSDTPSPLRRETHHRVPPPLDMDAMRLAAAQFVGRRDFTAFMSRGSTPQVTHVRTIFSFDVVECADADRRGEIHFYITGDGFLYNMARIMVMAVINCGRGRLKPADIPVILEKKERLPVREIAPAKGLYLFKAEYM